MKAQVTAMVDDPLSAESPQDPAPGAERPWTGDPKDPRRSRFTEDDTRYQGLYAQARSAQWTPEFLRTMDESDLFYIAGHQTQPDQIEAPDWSKLSNNAYRASLEVQRRWEAAQNRRLIIAGIVAAVLGALLAGLAALAVTLAQPTPQVSRMAPPTTTIATTTTTIVPPTTVATTSAPPPP